MKYYMTSIGRNEEVTSFAKEAAGFFGKFPSENIYANDSDYYGFVAVRHIRGIYIFELKPGEIPIHFEFLE